MMRVGRYLIPHNLQPKLLFLRGLVLTSDIQILKGGRRVVACFVVFLGALGMSTVGAWA